MISSESQNLDDYTLQLRRSLSQVHVPAWCSVVLELKRL